MMIDPQIILRRQAEIGGYAPPPYLPNLIGSIDPSESGYGDASPAAASPEDWQMAPPEGEGQPMPSGDIQIDAMMPSPPRQGNSGPKSGRNWRTGIGDMIDGVIASVATPNIAGGGATDIARGMMSARGAMRQNEGLRQQQIDRQIEQRRRQELADAEMLLRQRQIQAATPRPEDLVEINADLARQAGVAVPLGQATIKLPKAIAQQIVTYNRPKGKAAAGADKPTEPEIVASRVQIATTIGLKPGTAEFNMYTLTGKLPTKPAQPPKPTEEETRSSRRAAALRAGLKEGTREFQEYELTGKLPKQEKPPAGQGTQQARLALEVRKYEEGKQDKQNERREKELLQLDAEENGSALALAGGRSPGKAEGLHSIRTRIGESMKTKPATPEEIAAYNSANSKLRAIYKRKLDLGAITPQQYQQYVSQLKDIGGATQPAPPPTQTTQQKAPSASVYANYVPGKGVVPIK